MLNPLLNPLRNLYLYLLVWGVITAFHTLLLPYFFSIGFVMAFVTSLVFNIVFASLAIGLWYIVRFLKIDNQSAFRVVINHVVTACLFLLVWIVISFIVIEMISMGESVIAYNKHGNIEYENFLIVTLPPRLFMGVLFYCLIILFYYLNIYYVSFKRNLIKNAELNSIIKETQLELLQSQLNPHFIFNCLNSISSLTISDPTKAQDMVIKLSSFLRYSLGQKTSQLVPFHEELKNCLLYLEIEKTRFGNRLALQNEVSDDCLEDEVPNMIMQPLIENAVKHGVYESTEQVVIKVDCKRENSLLVITISNNYESGNKKTPGKNMGIRNVRDRLSLLYGKGEWMAITNSDNLYTVTLRIP